MTHLVISMGPLERVLHYFDTDDESLRVSSLVGPTAVGKTSLSIQLAQLLDAEIISADSRQVYRETTIGTAKPTLEELAKVPHHFIDERSISESFTAAEFADQAHERIADINSRGKRVLVVGGSTLYIHALLFGLDDVPPTDPQVREALNSRMQSDGLEALKAELEAIDPETASRIDLNNPRRVLRALEVYHGTGRPLSWFQNAKTSALRSPPSNLHILYRPRETLYARIGVRVDAMFKAGLVDEVRAILAEGHSPALQALQTIGYRETIDYLNGEFDHERMIELVKRNTRRYAKRQLTWFRRYNDAHWIDVSSMPR